MNFIVIPISLSDSYKRQINALTEVPPTLIFIGNNWYVNIHGLKWFVNNVLDHVNIKLLNSWFRHGCSEKRIYSSKN
jgi:hypothetical protein